ncbi:MAG: hypothetical protein K2K63_03330 [Acetatifactor sp.]|nr:hypothetical protein [Acetatifactor sp.]
MTSEEARISLSFHSGRNSNIKDPRWINGFLGSLRKFNGDIIEENFIDVMNCLKVLAPEFASDSVDKNLLADVYGILYYTTIWIQEGGRLSDIDCKIRNKIKYWMQMYSYAIVLLLDYSEQAYKEAFTEFDDYLMKLPK